MTVRETLIPSSQVSSLFQFSAVLNCSLNCSTVQMFFLPPFAPISSSISVSFVVCLESFPNIAKLIPLTCFWPYRCQALCKCPKQFKIYFSEGPQMINNNHNDSFKWVSSLFAFKCALMDNCLSEESSVFSPSLSVFLLVSLTSQGTMCNLTLALLCAVLQLLHGNQSA